MGCKNSKVYQTFELDDVIFHNPLSAMPLSSTPLAADDFLIGLQMASLCLLSYSTSKMNPEYKTDEQKFVKLLNISLYDSWVVLLEEQYWGSHKAKDAKRTKEGLFGEGGAQAISGVIENLAPSVSTPQVFICFRGTANISDVKADLASIFRGTLTSPKGVHIATTGLGYVVHLKALMSLTIDGETIVEKAVKKATELNCGIILSGHSLGGALATLCAAIIRTDHPEIPVRLFTFGCPRMALPNSDHFFQLEIDHVRFVNSGDLITLLGDEGELRLAHHGFAVVFHRHRKEWSKVSVGNFPHNINMKGTLEFVLEFLEEKANKHSLVFHQGYYSSFLESTQYQEAVSLLNEPFKSKFAQLPLYPSSL